MTIRKRLVYTLPPFPHQFHQPKGGSLKVKLLAVPLYGGLARFSLPGCISHFGGVWDLYLLYCKVLIVLCD